MDNENRKWVLLVVVVSIIFGILNMQYPILGSLLVGCIGGITGRILWETGK
jgi:uncharacterized membrane protein HdeD (DUF308 family)